MTLLNTAVTDRVRRDRIRETGLHDDAHLQPWVDADLVNNPWIERYLVWAEAGYLTPDVVNNWHRRQESRLPEVICVLHRHGWFPANLQALYDQVADARMEIVRPFRGAPPPDTVYRPSNGVRGTVDDLVMVMLAMKMPLAVIERWWKVGFFSYYDSDGMDAQELWGHLIARPGRKVPARVLRREVTASTPDGVTIVDMLSRYPGENGPVAWAAGLGSSAELTAVMANDPAWRLKIAMMTGLARREVTAATVFASRD